LIEFAYNLINQGEIKIMNNKINSIKSVCYVAATSASAAMPNGGVFEFDLSGAGKLERAEEGFIYENHIKSSALLAIAKKGGYDGYLANCELAKRSGDLKFANIMFANALNNLFVYEKPTSYAKYLAYVESDGEGQEYYDLLNLVVCDDNNHHMFSVCIPIPMLSEFVQEWAKELPTIPRREHCREFVSSGAAYKTAIQDSPEDWEEILKIYFNCNDPP